MNPDKTKAGQTLPGPVRHRWPAEARMGRIAALAAALLIPLGWMTDVVLLGFGERSMMMLGVRLVGGLLFIPVYLGCLRTSPPAWLERAVIAAFLGTVVASVLLPTALRPTSITAQGVPLMVILLIFSLVFPSWRYRQTAGLLACSGTYVGLGAYWLSQGLPGYDKGNELISAALLLAGLSVALPRVTQRIETVEDELIDAKERLQKNVRRLKKEVSLRKRREEALDRARDDAESANAAKTEFLASVSHELRTPLTAMAGSLRLLRGIKTNPEQHDKLIDVCDRNTQRLLDLVNQLLDAQSIAAGKFRVQPEPIRLAALLREAERATAGLSELYSVPFEFYPVSSALWVNVDAARLQQALTNLLSNAAKHSPTDEPVVVRVLLRHREEAESVCIEVCDRGSGIPHSFRARVFQRFEMADRSATSAHGGTGLGLSITKALVEAHGGDVGFESEDGEGATFWIELPLIEPPPQSSSRKSLHSDAPVSVR